MEYQAAMEELKAGKLYPIYLLWGEERCLREDLLTQIKKQVIGTNGGEYGLTILNGKDLSAERIIEAADTAPFFSQRQLILIEDWHSLRPGKPGAGEKHKPDEGVFIDYIHRIPPFSCLVFTSNEKIDRRKKLYQALESQGAVVELTPLKGLALERWMSQIVRDMGKKAEAAVLAFIISEAGASEKIDLMALRQELIKIALYSGARPEITKTDVQAVLTHSPESSVFMLVDAVSQRQAGKALRLWEDLKVAGQEPLKTFSLLARQIRLIWQAKQLREDGCPAEQMAGKLSIHPYVVQKVSAQGKHLSDRQLGQMLGCIQEADWAIKSGRRDPETTMRLLIVSLCKNT